TDWRIVQPGAGDQPSLVVPDKSYVMKPGDAHLYDVGVVHSPKRDGLTKLVRIEGANLDRIKRSNIKAAAKVDEKKSHDDAPALGAGACARAALRGRRGCRRLSEEADQDRRALCAGWRRRCG